MPSITVENIAKVCHEANRAYCEAYGDYSQVSWGNAPEWQKTSAIDGVLFLISQPEATPEQAHENWLRRKRAEGWKYGLEKNPEAKTHPCCVPYAELPMFQKAKDQLFLNIIRIMEKNMNALV